MMGDWVVVGDLYINLTNIAIVCVDTHQVIMPSGGSRTLTSEQHAALLKHVQHRAEK